MAELGGYQMTPVRGSLIGLKINGYFVSCETGCEFSFNRQMLPASARKKGGAKEFVGGDRNWTMSVNGNLLMQSVGADIKTVLGAVLSGQSISLEFRTKPGISPYLSIKGKGIPQTGNISAPLSGKANWALTFQGTGPFETDFEQFALVINSMPASSTPDTTFNLS